jgi:hypothetical protein
MGMRNTQYRFLRSGEERPEGEPKRYWCDRPGYERLRWKVAPGKYVECYEQVEETDEARERRAEHERVKRERWDAKQRERTQRLREVVRRHVSGATPAEVAAAVGMTEYGVTRALKAAGMIPKTGHAPKAGRIPNNSRLVVQGRAELCCERCGHGQQGGGGHCHHRQRRREGDHRPLNLLFLCPGCHRWVHGHPALARKFGYIVLTTDMPETIPMIHWRLGEVYLTPAGGYIATEECVQ